MSATYPPEINNSVTTSWIPLTTGWTEISECTSLYIRYQLPSYVTSWLDPDKNSFADLLTTVPSFVAYDPLLGILDPHVLAPYDPRCLPDQVTIWNKNHNKEDEVLGIRSIVTSLLPLRCPDAWQTVTTFVKSSISTQAMCCPP